MRLALGQASVSTPLDPALADLAIRRHRVGPLLHAAIRHKAATDDAALRLRQDAATNAKRAAIAELIQARMVRLLADGGVPSLIFKGGPMARRLYGDAALRHCGDIDLLVPPAHFRSAAKILCKAGFLPAHAPLTSSGTMSPIAARLLRDVGLRDALTGQRIELHQRLLFLATWTTAAEAVDASFLPRLPGDGRDIPSPEIGPVLALYLLQHGALSGWRRLKWLADIRQILDRMPPHSAEALCGLAEDCGTATSVKAGLALAQIVFGSPLPAALEAWLAERTGAAAIARRLAYYAAMLSEPTDIAPSPANSRVQMLKASALLADRASQRAALAMLAPAASIVRFVETTLRAGKG